MELLMGGSIIPSGVLLTVGLAKSSGGQSKALMVVALIGLSVVFSIQLTVILMKVLTVGFAKRKEVPVENSTVFASTIGTVASTKLPMVVWSIIAIVPMDKATLIATQISVVKYMVLVSKFAVVGSKESSVGVTAEIVTGWI